MEHEVDVVGVLFLLAVGHGPGFHDDERYDSGTLDGGSVFVFIGPRTGDLDSFAS